MRRARASDLVERIQSAVLAAASERGSEHLRRLAEVRRGEVVDGASEIGVVEEVEEVGAGLEGEAFVEAELAAEGQVDLGGAEAAEGVASEVALYGSGGGGEGAQG